MKRKLNLDPPKFVGNKGVAINSVRNLQKRLNREERYRRVATEGEAVGK